MLDPHAKELVEKIVALGLKGHPGALRILAERLLPKPRDEFVYIRDLPGEPGEQAQEILRAVSEGKITPSEGEKLSRLVETRCRVVEFSEFAERLDRLEKLLGSDAA